MSLLDSKGGAWSIEQKVRAIMKREGRTELTTADCKIWARHFICARVRDWRPGVELTPEQARHIGAALTRCMERYGIALDLTGEIVYRPRR